jgi:bla regulator protein blaR1
VSIMAPLFADLLVRSTLLIGLTWAAVLLMKRQGASAAMRHIVWLSALIGLLMLPLLTATLPKLELPVLSETTAPAAAAPAMAATLPEATATAAAAPMAAPAAEPARPGLPIWPLYLIVVSALLARFVGARLTLARLWREADPADEGWIQQADSAAATLRMRRRVALRIARTPLMPMTWGTLSPRILLPAEARGWTEARRRLVLLHELAHVRRRDSLTQSVGWLACALYWLHPGAWLAARQMRLEQEVAADDLAIGAGTAPRLYAENLLELAGTLALPAPAMARVSELERRIVAIVGRTSRRAPGRSFAAVAGCGAMAATWLAATALPVHAMSEALPAMAIPASTLAAQVGSAAAAPVAGNASVPAPAAPATAAEAVATTAATPATAAVVASAPLAPVANVSAVSFLHQLDAQDAENDAAQQQAMENRTQAAILEREARARGNDRLADHIHAQREAYGRQIAVYGERRVVLARQRRVNAQNIQIEADRPADLARQEEAKRDGQPIPPLRPYLPVPPLPAVPPIPPIPANLESKT